MFQEAAPEAGLLQCKSTCLVLLPHGGGFAHQLLVGLKGPSVVHCAVDLDAHKGEYVVLEVLSNTRQVSSDSDADLL